VKSYTEASHGVGWFIRKSFLLTLLSFYPQPSCVKLHMADMRTLRPVRSVMVRSLRATARPVCAALCSGPSPANAIEYYIDKNQFFHPLSDTHYSIIVRDGTYYQRRW
jgi:hypothetical protein